MDRPGGFTHKLSITGTGIEWHKTVIPWGSIKTVDYDAVRRQHGKTHGAIGIGPVGLAVVAGTMLHNHNAKKIDVVYVLVVIDTADRKHVFMSESKYFPGVVGPLVNKHRERVAADKAAKAKAQAEVARKAAQAKAEADHRAAQAKRTAESLRAATEAAVQTAGSKPSVADELAKMADLRDKGVLSEEEFAEQKKRLLS